MYAELIEMYSKRRLSFDLDILPAITGMLNIAHERLGGQIIAGIPSKYLDLALLWSPADAQDRIGSVGLGDSAHPTWSWTGWTNAKEYRIMEFGRDTYGSLHHEYATSEIAEFSMLHNGKLDIISKTHEQMTATEIRDLGSRPERPIKQVFPRYIPYTDSCTLRIHGPDFGPNVLQFWAYTVSVEHFSFMDLDGALITDREHGNISGKQVVNGLLDRSGKHCGLIFKPRMQTKYRQSFGTAIEFVLVSSFGDTEKRRSGIATMDTDLKPFDEYAFPWQGEGSGLVNLMMVEWFEDVAERIIVAQIHRLAWEAARPVWKHVRLA